jgi:putative sterol carrier protein
MDYDKIWWMNVIEVLNNDKRSKEFSGLGNIVFNVSNHPNNRVFIHWNENGKALIIEPTDELIGFFSATKENWDNFIAGKFNAGQGVLLGKIKFTGSFSKVIKFIGSFNYLAEIARKLKN